MKDITTVLLDLGIDASLKGFNYIKQIMPHISENEHTKITALYNIIAKKNLVTWQSVERCIRHAIEVAVNNNTTLFRKYFGNYIKDCTGSIPNKTFLCTIIYVIKGE